MSITRPRVIKKNYLAVSRSNRAQLVDSKTNLRLDSDAPESGASGACYAINNDE